MSRTLSTLAAAALCALTATAAQAARPPVGATTSQVTVSPTAAQAVLAIPKFSCTINPAGAPKGDEFQVTQYTVKLVSGTPAANKKIKVALGIQPNGPALPGACTADLKNGSLTATNVIVAPPITDGSYIWLCNASQTSETCDPPPAVPR